jgi:hypothetical protein
MDEHGRAEAIKLLELAQVAEAAGELLDSQQIAQQRGTSEGVVRERIKRLANVGLLLDGSEENEPPIVLTAGKQFLARGGEVSRDVLHFMAQTVEDLNARQALLTGGTILVDEYRYHIHRGNGVEFAKGLVPPAFEQAVSEWLALNLFAAAVALMTRLSDGRPAGCVAEEILAVRLIENAQLQLDMSEDLSAEEVEDAAEAAKGGVFELFEDDDVLDLFEMEEPSDAALAGHSQINQESGVADQRIESWFKPFSWAIATGYIGS